MAAYEHMNRRGILGRAAVIFLLAALAAGAESLSRAQAEEVASAQDAAAFIERLGNQAVRLYATSSRYGSERHRIEAIKEIVHNYVDLEGIGRFALGPLWRNLSARQREQYLTAYRAYALDATTWRFSAYRFMGFRMLTSRSTGNGEAMVETIITQGDRPTGLKEETSDPQPFIADWRVAREGDRYKIVDVVIEGVSLALAQRREFLSIIDNKGLDGLLAVLAAREAALQEWIAGN